MVNKKLTISLLIAISLGLVGCNNSPTVKYEEPTVTQEEKEKFDFNTIIGEADTINIKENIFNFNKVYKVSVDNETIGEINGEYINITGDIFTLTDKYDREIASEKQIKRWGIKLNRLAEVYDANGNVSGYIGEEKINDFFSLGRIMHFYDADKNEIGTCKQKVFNILDEYVIYDNEGNEDYRIKEEFTIMEPEYNIEVKDKDSIIKPTNAVFVTSILDAIRQAESSKEN